MTIAGNPYGQMRPPRVRRGFVWAGLVLIVSAIPLTLPLGNLAGIVSFAGGACFAYALFPSSYPWLGLFGGSVLAGLPVLIGIAIFKD